MSLIAPTSLPFGQSADWGTSLPILITILLGIPLVIVAAVTARSGFFHEKTVSYVLQDGVLVSAMAGGGTMELTGGPNAGPPPAAPTVVDPAAQSRSSNE